MKNKQKSRKISLQIFPTLLVLAISLEACGSASATQLPAISAPATEPTTTRVPTQPPLPSITPSATRKPTATPLPPVVFTSSRFGYSITLPAGWQMEEVPGTWDGTTASPAGEPGTDAFYKSNPKEFVPLEIGFLAVKPGTTVQEWEQEEAARPQEWTRPCTPDPKLESVTIGGEPALLQHVNCPNHPDLIVYLVHRNQGIYMDYQGNFASIKIFRSTLETFTFH